ncbi:tyrosine-type recombinase/integrase [Allorhodopirellula solitaria]|nr:tyrosine-type recombinase/integrase [Allorhodopirellula solitaria]
MPDYRYHVSGQGVVELSGKTFYLGTYDSPESRAKYFALLQIYNGNGLSIPDDLSIVHQQDVPVSVRCVTAEFREHVKIKYARSPSHNGRLTNLCKLLEDEYGDEPAAEFGPRKLAALRDTFVASGNNRNYANSQTRSICQIFKYGVARELIEVSVLQRLETLEPLRQGQTTAKETKPRQPISLEVVRATARYLSPTIKAMVMVQLATGMRPSEVFAMRPRDIDQRGDEWIYRPDSHKTAHHGVTKAVPIVGDARLVVARFLDRPSDQYLFSPIESAAWHREQRSLARKTHKSCGNRVGSNLKKDPKRKPGEMFTKDSYRRAVVNAAKKAEVEHWTPYQLRYTAAAAIREALGIEAAQAILGHTKAAMTEHYAKSTEAKAIEAAKVGPTLGAGFLDG